MVSHVSSRCFFYGDVNCQKDKNVYLDNILRLYDYFRDEYYQTTENSNSRTTVMPLVINTSGWVKGLLQLPDSSYS